MRVDYQTHRTNSLFKRYASNAVPSGQSSGNLKMPVGSGTGLTARLAEYNAKRDLTRKLKRQTGN